MTKIALLVAIVYLFILFFRVQGRFLVWIADSISATFVFYLLRIGMALLTGWVIYILIAMVGMFDRIRSLDDIFTILRARPSQIGGSAMIGLAVGGVFAFLTYRHWYPNANSSVIQGQTVRFDTLARRAGLVGWLRRQIQRRIR